jgi:hypothetical protein
MCGEHSACSNNDGGWLEFIDFIEKGFGIIGTVVLNDFWGETLIDLIDKLR